MYPCYMLFSLNKTLIITKIDIKNILENLLLIKNNTVCVILFVKYFVDPKKEYLYQNVMRILIKIM